MRVSKTLPALLLACALLPAADETAASISGTVVNRAGMPVPGAGVILSNADNSGLPIPAATDVHGRFSRAGLAPGVYRYMVVHRDYVKFLSHYDITLKAGQHLSGLAITLDLPATVTGRIIDTGGQPLSGLTVEVRRPVHFFGRPRSAVIAARRTNDNGEMKITGIPPGNYYLKAADTTKRITLAPEQELNSGDWMVHRLPRIVVRGAAIGGLLSGARVARMPLDPGEGSSWNDGSEIQADGSFEIDNLWPDRFALAVYNDSPNRILGWTVITAGEEDMRDVLINASAAPLSGAIRIDGDAPLKAGSQPLSLLLTAAESPSVIDVSATISPEGAFQIPLLAPGKYIANLLQLPPGWYVKSMELDRRDALNNGLDFTIGGSKLDILLSPRAAAIHGVVLDKEGNPLRAKVTLIPETPRPGHARLYPATTTAEDGTFQLESITPGRYRIYAWEHIPDTAHWDEAYIEPYRANAQRIELKESEHARVTLNRIPHDGK